MLYMKMIKASLSKPSEAYMSEKEFQVRTKTLTLPLLAFLSGIFRPLHQKLNGPIV